MLLLEKLITFLIFVHSSKTTYIKKQRKDNISCILFRRRWYNITINHYAYNKYKHVKKISTSKTKSPWFSGKEAPAVVSALDSSKHWSSIDTLSGKKTQIFMDFVELVFGPKKVFGIPTVIKKKYKQNIFYKATWITDRLLKIILTAYYNINMSLSCPRERSL